jgi:hypothetical protein
VVGATGVILAAVYLLWAYQRVFHGEPDEANSAFPDMTWREKAVMLPLVAIIVFMGVYPKPVLQRIEPSVNQLLDHVQTEAKYHSPLSLLRPKGRRRDSGCSGRRSDQLGQHPLRADAARDHPCDGRTACSDGVLIDSKEVEARLVGRLHGDHRHWFAGLCRMGVERRQ